LERPASHHSSGWFRRRSGVARTQVQPGIGTLPRREGRDRHFRPATGVWHGGERPAPSARSAGCGDDGDDREGRTGVMPPGYRSRPTTVSKTRLCRTYSQPDLFTATPRPDPEDRPRAGHHSAKMISARRPNPAQGRFPATGRAHAKTGTGANRSPAAGGYRPRVPPGRRRPRHVRPR